MAAFDINYLSASLDLAENVSGIFARIVCGGFCVEFECIYWFLRDWIYIMFCERLYVPKWVAKGRKVQEFGRKRSESLVPKRSQCRNRKCILSWRLWHWQRYWQWLWQCICSKDTRIAISFSTSGSQCMAMITALYLIGPSRTWKSVTV